MSKFFVTDPPVPIVDPDNAANIIYIRPRMDSKTEGKVKSEIARMGDNNQAEYWLGMGEAALRRHNIVKWEGPDFCDERGRLIPCTPENIDKLDPKEPFIQRVTDEISTRNTAPQAPDPKLSTANGSTNAGLVDSTAPTIPSPARPSASEQLATTNLRSPAPSSLVGRLNRSNDSIPTS